MADTTATVAAITVAHKARSEVYTLLATAEAGLSSNGPHRAAVAREALQAALEAADRMRAAIITAQTEIEKLSGKAADGG